MRNLDDCPTVKHNGRIYFQVGLLASLIAVYFIIELKTPVSEVEGFKFNEPIDLSDKPFTDVIVIEKVVEKQIARVEPKITPKVTTKFEEIPNDTPEPETIETVAPDDTEDVVTPNETPTNVTEDKPKVDIDKLYGKRQLDELPTFLACTGLDAAAQQKCFNEQMQKFLKKTLQYPARAQENERQGSILVEFEIGRDGTVSNVKPADADKFNDKDLEKEALRVIGKLPKLKPGKVKGEPVKVRYTIPITFKLNI